MGYGGLLILAGAFPSAVKNFKFSTTDEGLLQSAGLGLTNTTNSTHWKVLIM